jgi:hypothetical protein
MNHVLFTPAFTSPEILIDIQNDLVTKITINQEGSFEDIREKITKLLKTVGISARLLIECPNGNLGRTFKIVPGIYEVTHNGKQIEFPLGAAKPTRHKP